MKRLMVFLLLVAVPFSGYTYQREYQQSYVTLDKGSSMTLGNHRIEYLGEYGDKAHFMVSSSQSLFSTIFGLIVGKEKSLGISKMEIKDTMEFAKATLILVDFSQYSAVFNVGELRDRDHLDDFEEKKEHHRKNKHDPLDDIAKFQKLRKQEAIDRFEFRSKKRQILEMDGKKKETVYLSPYIFNQLKKLKKLNDQGAIDRFELRAKKRELFAKSYTSGKKKHKKEKYTIFRALRELKQAYEEGVIDRFEFRTEKREILDLY
ncbi:MAG: hypothetical protein GY858_09565 [Candidatus Omnitrophica bacterium]|nr:hypothetical protein [Candidatus Omnitrophota bacterium]